MNIGIVLNVGKIKDNSLRWFGHVLERDDPEVVRVVK